MTCIGTAGLRLAIGVVLSLFVAVEGVSVTEAAKPTYQQAMKACRAKYGSGITNVIFKKNGGIVCQEGPRNPTRQQVYDYCKKTYSAQTVFVRKLANGKWECRYYGRY